MVERECEAWWAVNGADEDEYVDSEDGCCLEELPAVARTLMPFDGVLLLPVLVCERHRADGDLPLTAGTPTLTDVPTGGLL